MKEHYEIDISRDQFEKLIGQIITITHDPRFKMLGRFNLDAGASVITFCITR